ncbi:hypothetical protein ABZT04_09715 [Streptomyces sp. NPDC005492]|uniref:hypothetical protein n=1 Tax=Streptomyces sp. NPDC005492 TaxID=3156883 RepID=UPI00339EE160
MLARLRLADSRTPRDSHSTTARTDTGRPIDTTPATPHHRSPAHTDTETETL